MQGAQRGTRSMLTFQVLLATVFTAQSNVSVMRFLEPGQNRQSTHQPKVDRGLGEIAEDGI